ncbi:MAG: TetR/AcrR family transcriptional regulator [Candidatus Nanopelagicales bacterium]
MPAIDAPTVAEHRERRRDTLVHITAEIMIESGCRAVTMASVAKRAGLSRTAVYEYYNSAGDIVADVIVDEMHAWCDYLDDATRTIEDPQARIEAWIRSALGYVSDGRHAIVRAAADATLPPVRQAQVHALHRQLAQPLTVALTELNVAAPERTTAFIWSLVDAATRRIEGGRARVDEVDAVTAFVLAGIITSL